MYFGNSCAILPPSHLKLGAYLFFKKIVYQNHTSADPGLLITNASFSQVTLVPEEAEDMWHTYNLLQVGDSLRASTIR